MSRKDEYLCQMKINQIPKSNQMANAKSILIMWAKNEKIFKRKLSNRVGVFHSWHGITFWCLLLCLQVIVFMIFIGWGLCWTHHWLKYDTAVLIWAFTFKWESLIQRVCVVLLSCIPIKIVLAQMLLSCKFQQENWLFNKLLLIFKTTTINRGMRQHVLW